MRVLSLSVAIIVAMLMGCTEHLWSQVDTIGGVINRYTRLTYIECTNNSSIIVENPYGFNVGDRILIIQMKGAVIDVTNTLSFGTIDSYNNAGNYELATIDEIHGKSFVLKYRLARTYSLEGLVQVIRVPSYTNVLVNDVLRAQPWNGSTGGVLAFIASGTVTMNANIDVRGQGFRGMAERWPNMTAQTIQPNGSGILGGSMHHYSNLRQWDSGGAKGEGIHEGQLYYMGSRGKLASGGGGGNSEQSGGGGGGNAGSGGVGGDDYLSTSNGGVGGAALTYSNNDNRVFLGGSGGWSGPSTLVRGFGGESGGGIILIKANEIDGNSRTITASGNDAAQNPSDPVTGEGGGAGGVVVLDVDQYTDALSVEASGGDGGSLPIGCIGPGGGGGGGCVWVKGAALPPANVTINVDGGVAGTTNCGAYALKDDEGPGTSMPLDPNYGAGSGTNGVKLTGLQIPVSTTPR